uniref:Uncharacterized protein n=1 Tax=Tetraselmis sp. GSL018 TaxID=582737 RepID=A0A061S6L4_9CHLO|mmetsp:Transcript_41796/g.99145  ORF Transcript_41796/g.99145 Transcript_41796/m.99145 type:complete len:134 (-) Transcript_41796:218-619(-)
MSEAPDVEEFEVDIDKVEFSNRTDFGDDKVNDGRNYQGLLSHSEYLKRKSELVKEPVNIVEEATKRKKLDDAERARDEKELKVRLEEKKQKLRKELEQDNNDGQKPSKRKTKKQKRKDTGILSFDLDDDGVED